MGTFQNTFLYPIQIHILETGKVQIFSRNQEDNTSKYPDIVSRIPKVRDSSEYQKANEAPQETGVIKAHYGASNESFYTADNHCTYLSHPLCLSFSLFGSFINLSVWFPYVHLSLLGHFLLSTVVHSFFPGLLCFLPEMPLFAFL